MWRNRAARCGRTLWRECASRNPVLVRALAVSPVLAVTVSLKNGVLISIVMLLELVILFLLRALFYRRLPEVLRGPVFFAAAGAAITPLWMAARYFVPDVTAAVGFYLPLLAACAFAFVATVPAPAPLPVQSSPEAEEPGAQATAPAVRKAAGVRRIVHALLEAAGSGLGFAFAAVAVSGIREAIGSGTLYDRVLPGLEKLKFTFLLLPPGAFLLLGFLLAAVQAVHLRRKRRMRAGEEEETSGNDG